jgi:hypothetical protein
MARSCVSISVGFATLILALLGSPGTLWGQSTGVLQATVRVVDYSPSLRALQEARTAAERETLARQTLPPRRSGQHLQPMTVTISYLSGQTRIE